MRWLSRKTPSPIMIEIADAFLDHFLKEVEDYEKEIFIGENDTKEDLRKHYLLEMQITLHNATFSQRWSLEATGLDAVKSEDARKFLDHLGEGEQDTEEQIEIVRAVFNEVKKRLTKEYQSKWHMRVPTGWHKGWQLPMGQGFCEIVPP